MHIEYTAGYLLFTLDEKELSLPQSHWLGFINDLKEAVPAQCRTYDPITKRWTIDEDYADVIYKLQDEYFTDKNQEDLFG